MDEQEIDWDATSRAWETATDRTFGRDREEQKPFLVEPFCAQVSWMGKWCPVYPFTEYEPGKMCHYLTREGYEDYRGPCLCEPEGIFQGIVERGTDEQKKALENLADMNLRYSVNPPANFPRQLHREQLNRALSYAGRIYGMLGLEEKQAEAQAKWRELNTFRVDSGETEEERAERLREQAEIDAGAEERVREFQKRLAERE